MSTWRLLAGLAAIGVIGVPLMVAARRVRWWLVPGWDGLEGRLADVVIALSIVTVVSDVLGAFGRFRTWWIAVGILVVSGVIWATFVRCAVDRPATPQEKGNHRTPSFPLPTWMPWFVALAIAVVVAEWTNALTVVFRHGIVNFDSLWYHLPIAAKLARSGSFLPIRFYDADAVVSTYPAGAEVMHSLGMIGVGSDLLSPLVNFGWFALGLYAAHVFGRRWGVAHLTTLAVLTVFATPVMIELQGTTALSDIMGIASLLCALAFLVVGRRPATHGQLVLVGLAIGLAASSKFVLLAPAVSLMVVAVALGRHHSLAERIRSLGAVSIGALATGSFWYVRNSIVFGSPIPSMSLGLGPVSLPRLIISGTMGTMIPTLTSPNLLTRYVLPDFFRALGIGAWLLIAVVPFVGIMVFRRRVEHRLRWLGGYAVVTVGFGLLTPQYLVNGTFASLWSNFRYLMPGLSAAVVVATVLLAARRAWAWKVVLLAWVATAATYWRLPIIDTSTGLRSIGLPWLTLLLSSAAALAIGACTIHRPERRPAIVRWSARSAGAIALVVSLVLIQPTYRETSHDYAGVPGSLYAWAHRHHHRRIAVEPMDFAEFIRLHPTDGRRMLLFQYPLYGVGNTNDVQTIATIQGHRAIVPLTCHAWWQELERRRITDVVTWVPRRVPVAESEIERWAMQAPSSRLILRSPVEGGDRGSMALITVDANQPTPC